MRALRYDRYGPPDVLRVVEVPEPRPKAGELGVRVCAASANPVDWKNCAGHMRWLPGFRGPPRGIGCDFAGEIVAVGGGATTHYVGERVFGAVNPFVRDGALAEFVVVSNDSVAASGALSDDSAAALPVAGGMALQALIDVAKLAVGQRVFINGAAGGVGHFAVQIAKHTGAYVVGSCGAGNAEFVRSLGADEVVDYRHDDFTRRNDRFDVVFDAAGVSSFDAARRVLTQSGVYLNTGGSAAAVIDTLRSAVRARLTSRQRAVPLALKLRSATWRRLAALAQGGALHAHIERTIAMNEVALALRAMMAGHGRGKIVVRP